MPHLSEEDRECIELGEVEVVVAVNDSRRRVSWGCSSSGEIYGSVGRYHIRIAGYFRDESGRVRKCFLVCPYALSLSSSCAATK